MNPKPNTEQLIEWVSTIERNGVNLTVWEEEFVASMVDKMERYGDRTFFSDAQAEQIERIYTERCP